MSINVMVPHFIFNLKRKFEIKLSKSSWEQDIIALNAVSLVHDLQRTLAEFPPREKNEMKVT